MGGAEGGARAVALLLARHWRATHDYAVICLASSSGSAELVAAAAFHQVFGRATGGAVRPQLLAAVRETVKEWAAEDRISAALPELGKPTGGRGLRAARGVTSERRKLAERAFQALPGASQCLLWHIEVEAEPISVPAGLLGVDAARAADALEQAREQFRQGCVRAHRELAPSKECRFYNRLLDVPIRRGGALLPDVQQHLMECRYCRHAAEQLSHFDGGLEVLLAETVLGWGARRYLDSRPGRGGTSQSPVVRPRGGRHRPAPARRRVAPRRQAKAVAVVGLTSLALLATVLAARGWSTDNGVPEPSATWGAPSGQDTNPSVRPGPVSSPSAASATDPVEIGHGRLRNLTTDLCLDLHGGTAADGAAAILVACSTAVSQQWSYQYDGLLRSLADPRFCLDSDPGKRSVVLAGCLVHAGEVQFDLTVRGEILLRWHKGRALAGEDGKVVVVDRDGAEGRRWVLETTDSAATGEPRKKSGAGEKGDKAAPEGEKGDGLLPAVPSPRLPVAPPSGGRPQGGDREPYETRVAQVDHRQELEGEGVFQAPVEVPAVVSDKVGAVVASLGSVLR
ncbi:RICIN domain-containing protein [Streptomyces sp. TLI_55]|uniref:RICIN domain-containing protein n=1 Tax=Streptomyces sp. TLI_55 TaxID=1938861 RepID=UPI00211CB412|nr:RICIN domain-containing protein [Streptomyces sp. TLI_55]